MAFGKKPMSEIEKKAKMSALKGANKMATDLMANNIGKYKDSPELKKHVKDMSDESGIDFKNDSDKIHDPQQYGNVIGRRISDEAIEREEDSDSIYNIDEVEAELRRLMQQKAKIMGKGK